MQMLVKAASLVSNGLMFGDISVISPGPDSNEEQEKKTLFLAFMFLQKLHSTTKCIRSSSLSERR